MNQTSQKCIFRWSWTPWLPFQPSCSWFCGRPLCTDYSIWCTVLIFFQSQSCLDSKWSSFHSLLWTSCSFWWLDLWFWPIMMQLSQGCCKNLKPTINSIWRPPLSLIIFSFLPGRSFWWYWAIFVGKHPSDMGLASRYSGYSSQWIPETWHYLVTPRDTSSPWSHSLSTTLEAYSGLSSEWARPSWLDESSTAPPEVSGDTS